MTPAPTPETIDITDETSSPGSCGTLTPSRPVARSLNTAGSGLMSISVASKLPKDGTTAVSQTLFSVPILVRCSQGLACYLKQRK